MIPVNTPLLSGNEKKYLNECIDTGWISSEGRFVKLFEEKFSNYVQRDFGVSCSSGSAALDIAIKALDLQKGDEIIAPSFTIISCIQSIVTNGCKPVLVDSDFYTFNMDLQQIKSKITPKTKAIMVVHIYGLSVDMKPILALVKKHNLKIIEDAAQAIGQECDGQKCGSFGDISVFSFYPNKHITTGEGGMLVMNDESLYKRAKSLRNLCFSEDGAKRFIHEDIGWNYRFTNLQAALGLAQLENIEKHIKKKRKIGKIYNKLLKDVKGINLPIKKTPYCKNLYWVYAITLEDEMKKSVSEITSILASYKIGTRPFFYPNHKQPVFKKMALFADVSFPNSEKLYKRGFYLPSGLGLEKKQIKEVCEVLKKALDE